MAFPHPDNFAIVVRPFASLLQIEAMGIMRSDHGKLGVFEQPPTFAMAKRWYIHLQPPNLICIPGV
ncbi:hypothetical protein E5D57_002566 [Metarhizium anisopliae]|nr:hypothetical protein E5D57_002566 [Metarhizium anisopliae]